MLTLLPKCVPAEELVAAKRRFGELGRRTGPLRDLDVLLLSEASCTAAVVPDLQAGLKRFFDMVRRRRDAASREVGDFVGTKTYRRSIEDWLRALQEAAWSGETCTGQANRPVAEVADRLIAKRLKRVLRSGKNIDATSPDAELHALRLHCKKLRYALEFFADLYEPKVMRKMIRQVKDFQEILGEFSDLSVHLSLLRTWLTEADDDTTDGPEDRDRVAAVGALIQSLSHRQGVLRRRFHDAFERFAGTDPVRML